MPKLMVVDDDETIRTCVTACLEAVGFVVIQAEDGLDALDKYRSMADEISLVIMDVIMPNLNGIDATKRIREINPSSKVVLMSGASERALNEATPDAFLPKPFRGKELYQVVHHILPEHEFSQWVAS